MREVRASAPGKVNLTLRVGAPTPDGYHPLVTVFEALNLRETVTVRTSKTPGVRVETIAYLPDDSVDEATTRAMADLAPQTHLAVRAARVLQRLAAAGPWASTAAGLNIRVDKRVPVAGGMAGGSADAAAALVACNELWELGLGAEQLQAIGRSLGTRRASTTGSCSCPARACPPPRCSASSTGSTRRVRPPSPNPRPRKSPPCAGNPRNCATASSMTCRHPPCACVPSWPTRLLPRGTREPWPSRCPGLARPSRPSHATPSMPGPSRLP